MTFDEWFDRAWREGTVDGDYKHDTRAAAKAGWEGALDAAIAVVEDMTQDQHDEVGAAVYIRALKK